jgi:hypothetical protein
MKIGTWNNISFSPFTSESNATVKEYIFIPEPRYQI